MDAFDTYFDLSEECCDLQQEHRLKLSQMTDAGY